MAIFEIQINGLMAFVERGAKPPGNLRRFAIDPVSSYATVAETPHARSRGADDCCTRVPGVLPLLPFVGQNQRK
jgi:hypothetical protein